MKISITIDRGQTYRLDTDEGKEAKKIYKSLIATKFPMHIMATKKGDEPQILSYSGTVEDFVVAMNTKRKFLKSNQTIEDKKTMVDEMTKENL